MTGAETRRRRGEFLAVWAMTHWLAEYFVGDPGTHAVGRQVADLCDLIWSMDARGRERDGD